MSQKLAEPKKKNQTLQIVELWKKHSNSYNQANNVEKLNQKRVVYDSIEVELKNIYGKEIPRSSIRRAVNAFLDKQ